MPQIKKAFHAAAFIFVLLISVYGARFFDLAVADNNAQFYPTSSPPAIVIESPDNHTIYEDAIQLKFTVNYLTYESSSGVNEQWVFWLGYSIDDNSPTTVMDKDTIDSPINSNTMLDISELSNGQHKIEVIVGFYYTHTIGVSAYNFSSAPVYFTLDNNSQSPSPNSSPSGQPTQFPEPEPEPFLTVLVIVSIASVAVAGVGLLFYFKKRKR
jgi:hypothetical protein